MSQRLIDELYDGDATRFKEAIAECNREFIRWKTLENAATILPHLDIQAQEVIEKRLGYLPSQHVVLPYEPFVRAIINSYQQGQITTKDYSNQLEAHIKLIRNADMIHNLMPDYDPQIYQNYTATFSLYGQMTRDRITTFLGYEPQLIHSLSAEMWLRKMFAQDIFQLPDYITTIDYKALTLIRYREILLEFGKEAADASPLLGMGNIVPQETL